MLGNLFNVVSVQLQGLSMESFLFSHEQCNRYALAVPGTAHLLSPILLLCECEDHAASTVLQSSKRDNGVWFHSARENQEQELCGLNMCFCSVCLLFSVGFVWKYVPSTLWHYCRFESHIQVLALGMCLGDSLYKRHRLVLDLRLLPKPFVEKLSHLNTG